MWEEAQLEKCQPSGKISDMHMSPSCKEASSESSPLRFQNWKRSLFEEELEGEEEFTCLPEEGTPRVQSTLLLTYILRNWKMQIRDHIPENIVENLGCLKFIILLHLSCSLHWSENGLQSSFWGPQEIHMLTILFCRSLCLKGQNP